jgi:hypothetical protein
MPFFCSAEALGNTRKVPFAESMNVIPSAANVTAQEFESRRLGVVNQTAPPT